MKFVCVMLCLLCCTFGIEAQNVLKFNQEGKFKIVQFTDVHNLLMQAESLFFAGEYKSSYEMTETIIHRISDKDKVDR